MFYKLLIFIADLSGFLLALFFFVPSLSMFYIFPPDCFYAVLKQIPEKKSPVLEKIKEGGSVHLLSEVFQLW